MYLKALEHPGRFEAGTNPKKGGCLARFRKTA
jgi:hypothetical protein